MKELYYAAIRESGRHLSERGQNIRDLVHQLPPEGERLPYQRIVRERYPPLQPGLSPGGGREIERRTGLEII